ncbi:MAG: methyltransferase domain-containing protein, partial [Candidatus Omnitrophica bacterium]|nr:methyltransferase domain-containing protein [Candidatus Omnitrophota bacterium]
ATPFWTMSVPHSGATSLIIAGDEVVSGTRGRVSITDIEANSVVWSENVAGVPLGLAAAGGRLFVSTDDGAIYCFGGDQPDPIVHRKEKDADPYGENATYAQAAKEILEKSGVTEGYCLDLGCGDGALAYELAHQSNLRIFGIESDPDKLAEARAKLDSAGLYGTRITLVQGDPSQHPLPEYFANLVVSAQSVEEGVEGAPARVSSGVRDPMEASLVSADLGRCRCRHGANSKGLETGRISIRIPPTRSVPMTNW